MPDADLVVLWTPEAADVVDTPVGRIGPVPFRRTGSHVERGFMLASGSAIRVGRTMEEPHATDLAPTILSMMGVPIPAYMEGKPVFEHARCA
jgi:hypothetical protein